MRTYSKAYYLKDLRRFPGWAEKERPDADELGDDTIVYLQDNLTVVRDVFEEEDFVFDDVTPEWEAFCRSELGFEIPEDLRFMYEEDEGETAAGEAADEAEPEDPPAGD